MQRAGYTAGPRLPSLDGLACEVGTELSGNLKLAVSQRVSDEWLFVPELLSGPVDSSVEIIEVYELRIQSP